jgi:hypothetical protein
MLRALEDSGEDLSSDFVRSAGVPGINHAAIVYFASSLLWRAAVAGPITGRISLGSRYTDELACFLRGEARFPANIVLIVLLARCGNRSDILGCGPAHQKEGEVHLYAIIVPGVGFGFLVGSRMPDWAKRGCFVHSEDRRIWVPDHVPRQPIADRMITTSFSSKLIRWGDDNLKDPSERI